jgi:hypothetical protein
MIISIFAHWRAKSSATPLDCRTCSFVSDERRSVDFPEPMARTLGKPVVIVRLVMLIRFQFSRLLFMQCLSTPHGFILLCFAAFESIRERFLVPIGRLLRSRRYRNDDSRAKRRVIGLRLIWEGLESGDRPYNARIVGVYRSYLSCIFASL